MHYFAVQLDLCCSDIDIVTWYQLLCGDGVRPAAVFASRAVHILTECLHLNSLSQELLFRELSNLASNGLENAYIPGPL
jgi:hypothetical protein